MAAGSVAVAAQIFTQHPGGVKASDQGTHDCELLSAASVLMEANTSRRRWWRFHPQPQEHQGDAQRGREC